MAFPYNSFSRTIRSIMSPRNLSQPSSIHLNQPQTPLFLKSPIHQTPLSSLTQFQTWAKTLIQSKGSNFPTIDNGPDTNHLFRELKWFLEDAGFNRDDDEDIVRLRVGLDELYLLWKQRIVERRPFQYVVGCEHWRDLVLSVEEGVLIPRPETEVIVDIVEELIKKEEEEEDENEVMMKEGLWVDLGTGSGALAIAIARALGKGGRVIATDLSPVAASVAGYNVGRYGLQDKIEIRIGSWFKPLEDVKREVVGLVSNPPYIPSDQILGLQAEVGKHEPRLALDGGENGMVDLLHLCEGAASVMKSGGFFAFETNGEMQSKFLLDFTMNKSKGCFRDVKIVSDHSGIQRFVTGFFV
ncbi:hypothetical protein GIB67_023913 [Kingdonia uniflora]|uniref:Uncharacterized protein n=1 Tax=Kingdonia uniflora TaxID=39325 RepID=A0A7J7NGL8_9MAGN|nr:hypothetical protein GIB67_023913 [Kingdonia uniflora]